MELETEATQQLSCNLGRPSLPHQEEEQMPKYRRKFRKVYKLV